MKTFHQVLFIGAIFSLFFCRTGHAQDVPQFNESNCVRALVGEAGGQGYVELLAHACALRNRGTLKGVYGFHAKHLSTEPGSSFQRAGKAYSEALYGEDFVNGRTEWRSEYDLKLMAKRGETPENQGLYGRMKVGQTWFYFKRHK